MADLRCSFCSKVGKARPLNMSDPIFGNYVRLMRRLKISSYKGPLGICEKCMPEYKKMQLAFQKKLITYTIAAIVLSVIYFRFTGNVLASMIIAVFIISLSLISYCPPLCDGIFC